eukprot:3194237-Pleurochrysis_carterae.AAC.7
MQSPTRSAQSSARQGGSSGSFGRERGISYNIIAATASPRGTKSFRSRAVCGAPMRSHRTRSTNEQLEPLWPATLPAGQRVAPEVFGDGVLESV